MIKEAITDINNIIVQTGLIERYGHCCTVKTGKNGVPFGYGLEKDCYGNTYTFDERKKNVAFLELFNFSFENINSKLKWLNIEIKIHHFLNQKHQDIEKYFGVHLQLYYAIDQVIGKFKTWMNTALNIQPVKLNIDNCEYTVMTINLRTIVPCDYIPDFDPDSCVPDIPELWVDLSTTITVVPSYFNIGDLPETRQGVIRISNSGNKKTAGNITFNAIMIGAGISLNIDPSMTGGVTTPFSPITYPVDNTNWNIQVNTVGLWTISGKRIDANETINIGVEITANGQSQDSATLQVIITDPSDDNNPNNNIAHRALSII